jgi:hypothetical protein
VIAVSASGRFFPFANVKQKRTDDDAANQIETRRRSGPRQEIEVLASVNPDQGVIFLPITARA